RMNLTTMREHLLALSFGKRHDCPQLWESACQYGTAMETKQRMGEDSSDAARAQCERRDARGIRREVSLIAPATTQGGQISRRYGSWRIAIARRESSW